jgi:Rieske Fe-S protein
MAGSNEPEPRRNWLLRSLQACIAVTSGAILYPAAMFLRPRPATSSGALEVVAPYRANDLKPDADGRWPPPFNFNGKPCLLIRTGDNQIRALSAICTHTDCTVEYLPAKGIIFCACHNGVYNLDGRNVSGPPPRPLEQHQVTLRGQPGEEEIVVSRGA